MQAQFSQNQNNVLLYSKPPGPAVWQNVKMSGSIWSVAIAFNGRVLPTARTNYRNPIYSVWVEVFGFPRIDPGGMHSYRGNKAKLLQLV